MANPHGLYDMFGNVSEWVQDFWSWNVPGKRDPLVTSGTGGHVIRGGSWFHVALGLRSEHRESNFPRNWYDYIGFRLVRNL